MMRGTFANIRLKNQMVPGTEGGVTIHYPDESKRRSTTQPCSIKAENVPLRDYRRQRIWHGISPRLGGEGTRLLGVRAVIAESFERIHRSNLVGMGVLPLVFEDGMSWGELGLKGSEKVTIRGFSALSPQMKMTVNIAFADGSSKDVPVLCRIDTVDELNYFRSGGILQYVLRNLAAA